MLPHTHTLLPKKARGRTSTMTATSHSDSGASLGRLSSGLRKQRHRRLHDLLLRPGMLAATSGQLAVPWCCTSATRRASSWRCVVRGGAWWWWWWCLCWWCVVCLCARRVCAREAARRLSTADIARARAYAAAVSASTLSPALDRAHLCRPSHALLVRARQRPEAAAGLHFVTGRRDDDAFSAPVCDT